jgi:hypothetical protein
VARPNSSAITIPGVRAARQGVGVIAVRAELVVIGAERLGGADRDGLLPDVQMAEAVDLPLLVALRRAFLEAPDEVHLPVHRQELVLRVLGAMAGGGISSRAPIFQGIRALPRRGDAFSAFQASGRARGSAPR